VHKQDNEVWCTENELVHHHDSMDFDEIDKDLYFYNSNTMPLYGCRFNVRVTACKKTLQRHIYYICKDIPSVFHHKMAQSSMALFRP
jgi:hypothetical protein